MWNVDARELSNCLNPWQFEMEHFKSQGSDAGKNLNMCISKASKYKINIKCVLYL